MVLDDTMVIPTYLLTYQMDITEFIVSEVSSKHHTWLITEKERKKEKTDTDIILPPHLDLCMNRASITPPNYRQAFKFHQPQHSTAQPTQPRQTRHNTTHHLLRQDSQEIMG